MDIDVLLALLFRYGLTAVYVAMLIFFKNGYQKSKTAGLPNKFFLGFSFMFLALLVMQAGIALYETVNAFAPGTWDLKTEFIKNVEIVAPALAAQVGIFLNFCKPLYILALVTGNMLIAGQVYPLELAIAWKKTPVTKLLVVTGLALCLVFIPDITYSILTQFLIGACFGCLGFGFLLNIAVNIHLFRISTGQIRRRSMFIILAFVCFYLGFIWSLEVGWVRFFIPGAAYKYDVVMGSILQMVAAIFYWVGFRQETTAPRPEK